MSDQPRGHPAAVAAWIMLAAVLVAGVAGVVGGIVSTAFVVDLVASWPLVLLALLIAVVAARRSASARSQALLPLSLFTSVVLVAALHLGGWTELPSAEVRLTGPPVTEMSSPTELILQLVGEVAVASAESDLSYQVTPVLRGGSVGVPSAIETSVDGAMSVKLEADPDAPGWYSFAGWNLTLSRSIPWRLVLNGRVDADLSELTLTSGTLAGRGRVSLGNTPDEKVTIIVAGDFTVDVPVQTAVTIDGDASVPDDWDVAGGKATSPAYEAGSPAWAIVIQNDGRVTVTEG